MTPRTSGWWNWKWRFVRNSGNNEQLADRHGFASLRTMQVRNLDAPSEAIPSVLSRSQSLAGMYGDANSKTHRHPTGHMWRRLSHASKLAEFPQAPKDHATRFLFQRDRGHPTCDETAAGESGHAEARKAHPPGIPGLRSLDLCLRREDTMNKPGIPQRPTSYDKRVALVLQGGGALGSYQAGVYEALADSPYLPDWIAGISIGAINAAIIAGNPPAARVDALRRSVWMASRRPPGSGLLFLAS